MKQLKTLNNWDLSNNRSWKHSITIIIKSRCLPSVAFAMRIERVFSPLFLVTCIYLYLPGISFTGISNLYKLCSFLHAVNLNYKSEHPHLSFTCHLNRHRQRHHLYRHHHHHPIQQQLHDHYHQLSKVLCVSMVLKNCCQWLCVCLHLVLQLTV